jgi:renalase
MDSLKQTTDVLVVGAGMAGLIAAREFLCAGRSVLVLDKGRGVGGRLASRRIDGATFDHGAQAFTTGDTHHAAVALRERLEGAVAEWNPAPASRSGRAHWRGVPSMSGVAKHLALGIPVELETTLTALHPEADHWVASTLAGHSVTAKAVILTPPVPQALALLDAGNSPVAPALRQRLNAIEYERCLAVMAVLEGPSRIPPPGGILFDTGPIASITDNQRKGISREPAITLQATPAFSLEHWDQDRMATGRLLLDTAAEWLGSGVRNHQVHGWRYSRPRVMDPEAFLLASDVPPLALAGDAFGPGGVEGAAFSGFEAAKAILARLADRREPTQ